MNRWWYTQWLRQNFEALPGPQWFTLEQLLELRVFPHRPWDWNHSQPSEQQLREILREFVEEGLLETGRIFDRQFWRAG